MPETNHIITLALADDYLKLAEFDRWAWSGYPNGEHLFDGEHTWRHWVGSGFCLKAEAENNSAKISGMIAAFHGTDEEYGDGVFLWLHKLLVTETARGSGLGQQLIKAFLALPRTKDFDIRLSVSPDNKAALHIYRKFGFTVEAEKAGYYRPAEDRYILFKPKA